MPYAIKWRRIGEDWDLEPKVLSHFLTENDKLVLHFEDGGLREIPAWKDCEIILGADWLKATRKKLAEGLKPNIKVEVVKE